MQKLYSRINWENEPSIETPLNEQNLNRMDAALDNVDNRVISQDAEKADKTELNDLVKDWVIDEETGIITVTKKSGEKLLFDLNIEKIPVDFSLSDRGILTMTTDDGTKFTANIGAMIPVLTFNNSDTIAVSVSGSGINKIYSFSIKNGSVTEEKLQPNFLSDIKVEVAKAESSAGEAESFAKQSQSYAVGTGNVRPNEATDNAKSYYEKSKEIYDSLEDSGNVTGVKGDNETNYRSGKVNLTPSDIGSLSELRTFFWADESSPSGWYRICSFTPANTIQFTLNVSRAWYHNAGETLSVKVSVVGGVGTNKVRFEQLGALWREHLITKARVTYAEEGDPWFLEIYYDGDLKNRIACSIFDVTNSTESGEYITMIAPEKSTFSGQTYEHSFLKEGSISEMCNYADKLDGLHKSSFLGNGTGFIRPNHIGGSTNMNDYTNEWHGFVYNMSNMPSGEYYGFLDATWFDGAGFSPAPPEKGGVVRQVFTSWNTGIMYTRVRPNNIWTAWRAIQTEGSNLVCGNCFYMVGNDGRKRVVLQAIEDGSGANNYGTQLMMGAGGNTFMGSGESASALYGALQTESNKKTNEVYAKDGENMFISADEHLYLYSNANIVANRKGLCFSNAGILSPIGTDSISLGTPTSLFSRLYIERIIVKDKSSNGIMFGDGSIMIHESTNNSLEIYASGGVTLNTVTVSSSLTVTITVNTRDFKVNGWIYSDLIPALVAPATSNKIGSSSRRWQEIWCSTSLNTSSDRNLKKNISDLSADDRYMKFFMLLQPKSYLFRDGESGRTHVGFISQDVEEAMAECGLSSLEFAGFCKDQKIEVEEIVHPADEEDGEGEWIERKEHPVFDEDGNPVYEYSLRYEEFIALNTMMIQSLQDRISEAEDRIAKIEEKLKRKDDIYGIY